jgi:hypothetical protein
MQQGDVSGKGIGAGLACHGLPCSSGCGCREQGPKQWVPFPALKKGRARMEPTMGSMLVRPLLRAGKGTHCLGPLWDPLCRHACICFFFVLLERLSLLQRSFCIPLSGGAVSRCHSTGSQIRCRLACFRAFCCRQTLAVPWNTQASLRPSAWKCAAACRLELSRELPHSPPVHHGAVGRRPCCWVESCGRRERR